MLTKIEKFDHQGRGITFVDDKTVFVENALPGEIVDINIFKNKKNIAEAKVVKITQKSNDRIDPICPYYKFCGGCDLMHINYQNQLKFKENKIKEIMVKFANLNTDIIKPIISNDDFNYRNKTTFHVKKDIGFYSKSSNDIISVDNCLISDKKINDILTILKKLDINNIYEILVRCSRKIDNIMVVLKINNSINENYFINELRSCVDTIIIYKDRKYKTIYGEGFIYEKLGDYKFKISPDSFFQVNTIGCEKLYNKVLEYLNPTSDDKVLDLYCGTGTIGIYISKFVKSVKGVEINKYAVIDANYNKDLNNIDNIDFECLDAADISKIKNDFDFIIVDPPRSGLDKKTIDYLLKSNSKKIVYVSCDPVTLARDLKLLNEIYDIKEITPVDMFPNTQHVESVVVLERR